MDQLAHPTVGAATRSPVEPLLCMDVLIILFDLLDQRRHVQSLMLTCKALYYPGVRHLLRFGADIRCAPKLLSFGQFMHNDLDTRAPLLRKLIVRVPLSISLEDPDDDTDSDNEFYIPDPDDSDDSDDEASSTADSIAAEAIPLLAPILCRASRLEFVSIDFFEEVLEQDEEALNEAFSALPTLRYLRMTSFGVRTLWLLPRLGAPLVEVDINFYYDGIVDPPDALKILSPFATSLEKISLWWADLGDEYVGLHPFTVRFPRVHTLSLRSYAYWSASVLPTLLHCFPNLETLLMGDLYPEFFPDMADDIHDRNSAVSQSRSFKQLNHLSGDLLALYTLGIARQVRRVDFTHLLLCNCAPSPVHTILEGTRPTHLHLHIGYGDDHDPLHEEHLSLLPGLLSYTGATEITHLGLDISAAFAQTTHNLTMDVARAVSRLPRVGFLVVRSQTESVPDFYDSENPGRRARSAPWSRLLQWQKRAKELAKTLRPLQFLVLDLDGIPPAYWRIVRNGYDVSLRSVDIAEGIEVVKAEGMEYHQIRRPPLCPSDYPPGFEEGSDDSDEE